MQTCQIHCDSCGLEISTRGNISAYRLRLSVESRRFVGGTATLLHVTPPLERDYDFCGTVCLTNWVKARITVSSDSGV